MNNKAKMNEIKDEIAYRYRQFRICKRRDPIIIESNFMCCLKKMFNKNYEPKTRDFWHGRLIADESDVQKIVITMLHSKNIDFIDTFVKVTDTPMSLTVYVLFKDNEYSGISFDFE